MIGELAPIGTPEHRLRRQNGPPGPGYTRSAPPPIKPSSAAMSL